MSKVKMGFSGLNIPEQVERARGIVTALTGNADFATPVPALSVVSLAATALETAYNESRNRDKNKVAIMGLRRKEMLALIVQLAAYVQEASAGDKEKILSSGFYTASPPTPKSDTAGEVHNVQLSDGSSQGKIRVDFDKATDAVLYVIVIAFDPEFKNPEPKGITTKTHKEIGGFDSGTKVWVRVIALGRENPGSFSDAVPFIVR